MKRPVPTLKNDSELDSFINATSQIKLSTTNNINNTDIENKIRKSLILKKSIDNALKLESIKTNKRQITIMEDAIVEYLQKRGYENI